MSDTLLRLPDVLRRTGLRRSTMYALAKRNEFPGPIKISTRTSAWVADEVEAWIRARISSRRGAEHAL
jgi:prophage regulatory protein